MVIRNGNGLIGSAASMVVLFALCTGLSLANVSASIEDSPNRINSKEKYRDSDTVMNQVDSEPFNAEYQEYANGIDDETYKAALLPYDWSSWNYIFGSSNVGSDGKGKKTNKKSSALDGNLHENNVNVEEAVSDYDELITGSGIEKALDDEIESGYRTDSHDHGSEIVDAEEQVTFYDLKRKHRDFITGLDGLMPKTVLTIIRNASNEDDFASSINEFGTCAEKALNTKNFLDGYVVSSWDDFSQHVQSCIKSCKFIIQHADLACCLGDDQPQKIRIAYSKMCKALKNLATECVTRCLAESDCKDGTQLDALSEKLGTEITELERKNDDLLRVIRPDLRKYIENAQIQSIMPDIKKLSKLSEIGDVDGKNIDEIVEVILLLRGSDSGYAPYLRENSAYNKVDFLDEVFKRKYDLDLKDNSQRILRFFDSNASLRGMLQELLTNNCKVAWAKDLKEHMDQFSNRVLKYKFDKLNQRIAVIHVIEDKQIDKNADKDIRKMQREIISDRIELRDELEDYVDSLSDKGRENFIQKANKLASFFGIKGLSYTNNDDDIVGFVLNLKIKDICFLTGWSSDRRLMSIRKVLQEKYDSEEVQKATKDFLSLFGRKNVIGKLKVALAENTELSWKREFRDMMNDLL